MFRDKYYFLSNFYPTKILFDGIVYDNAEAAFQAQKCIKYSDRKMFCGLEAGEARQLGRKIEIKTPNWEQVRVPIMKRIIRAKFIQNKVLENNLINTGGTELIEENAWHDTFWGMCNGEGQNMLGKILMDTREWLINMHPIVFIASKNEWLEHPWGCPVFISRTVDKKFAEKVNNNLLHWPDLAPSMELFSDYLYWRREGLWTQEKFNNEYTSRFMTDLKHECKRKKKDHQLNKFIMDYRSNNVFYPAYVLVCHCDKENMCHRSIIGGLLKAMGDIDVKIFNDYINMQPCDYPIDKAVYYYEWYQYTGI